MKLSSKTLFAAIAVPALLTACAGTGNNVKEITAADLQHHNWELTQIDGKAFDKQEHMKTPRLEVGEKMMANGSTGCNNFFGQAELKNNQFRIEKMAMTMMACISDSSMQTERVMSDTLTEWSNVTLTKDSLTLKNDVHTLTFTLHDWVN